MPDKTLPELIRSKYPGQYDDLSDEQLDAKVRERYKGVYDDIPGPTKAKSSETPTEKPKIAATKTPAPGIVAKSSLPQGEQQSRLGGAIEGGLQGAVKRVGDTALGIPLALDRLGRYVSGSAPDPNKFGGLVGKLEDAHRSLQPQGTAQKVGAGLADIGMFAAMPGAMTDSLGAAMASNAGMAGLQTGGDPKAMALGGAGGAVGYGAGKLLGAGANKMRGDIAHQFAHNTTDASVDPAELAKQVSQHTARIKNLGLEGTGEDSARIASGLTAAQAARVAAGNKTPIDIQKATEELNAISKEVGKPRSLTNIWSLLMAAGLIPASIAHGAGAGGIEALTPLILAAKSVLGKYPGPGAKALDKMAESVPRSLQKYIGAGSNLISSDPLGSALQQQEQVK